MTTRSYAADTLFAGSVAHSAGRCEQVLDAFLASRGDPSGEVDRLLADDPDFVFGHCLRAAIIVRGDDAAARSRLIESVTAIEAICPDVGHHARRHAFAARAWLDGDETLAVEHYGAIVVDFPHDIL